MSCFLELVRADRFLTSPLRVLPPIPSTYHQRITYECVPFNFRCTGKCMALEFDSERFLPGGCSAFESRRNTGGPCVHPRVHNFTTRPPSRCLFPDVLTARDLEIMTKSLLLINLAARHSLTVKIPATPASIPGCWLLPSLLTLLEVLTTWIAIVYLTAKISKLNASYCLS